MRSSGPLALSGDASRAWSRVNLGQREAGQRHIEVEIDEGLQFDRQDLAVPAGIECELIVGKQSPTFCALGKPAS